MNRIHRIVFNRSTGTCQAVSETASSHGSAGSSAGTSVAVPRLSRLTTACLLSLAALAGNPAVADGGDGGYGYYGSFPGGARGNAATADGGAGTNSNRDDAGGGGGGGGGVSLSGLNAGSGGAGGNGGASSSSSNPVAVGGAGGTVGATLLQNAPLQDVTGGAGFAGTAQELSGGGGGGGGGFGAVALQPGALTNAFTVSGGAGGAGATGNDYGGGGGGGEGGGGLLLTAGVTSLANTDTGVITGASGGAGGNDAVYYYPGAGGQGGKGLVVQGAGVVVTNAGTISGGAGGDAGLVVDGYRNSAGANGGAGVVGANLTIINSGSISGGAGGADYGTPGNAIEFTGGTNKLELHGGSVINGGILANGTSDTLTLAGNVDGTLAFTGQFSGFETFEKTGTARWTLIGHTDDLPTLDLSEGSLHVGDGQTYTSLQGKQGIYTQTVDDGLGNSTGAAGGKGQTLISVAGGALAVKDLAEIYGGDGANGSDSYANTAGGSATVVGATGGAGGAAVVLTQGSLSNEGYISGGSGGRGGYVYLNNNQEETFSALAPVPASYTVTGGAGGAGGNGVETSSLQAIINNGTIQGGSGSRGRYATIEDNSVTVASLTGGSGGAGGNGIVTSSTATLTNNGTVYGGSAGRGDSAAFYGNDDDTARQLVIQGGAGGAGGNAVVFTAVGAMDNQGSLEGGSANYGNSAYSSVDATVTGGAGGTGGAGALFALGGTAQNSGSITGGYGSYGGGAEVNNSSSAVVQGGAGGVGGHGIAMLAAGSVTNTGSIEGGGGGNGGTQANYTYSETEASTTAQGAPGGVGGAGVFFAANGALNNSANGVITGGQGGGSNAYAGANMSNEGAGVAQLTITSVASAAGGAGVSVGGIAAVTNDGLITGGTGGGNSYGGGEGFARSGGGPGNDGYANNYYGREAIATVYGNTGGTGGAALALAGRGLTTNNAGGTLQGGQGGTSSAYAYAYAQNESTSITATAIGGVGGVGGAGADLAGGSTLVNAGTVSGGQGGEGGYAYARPYREATTAALAVTSGTATGGNGGTGGVGVMGSHATVLNLAGGVIAGGEGGIAGGANVEKYDYNTVYQYTDGTFGTAGAGGVGITGSDLAVTNAGRISGGLSGAEASVNVPMRLAVQDVALPETRTRAAAIEFTGGINSLTLESTSVIEGKVIAFSAADTLALGGTSNSTFDVATIGPDAQYSGFGKFGKTGASTWTLTGANTAVTPWTINAGTLAIASDASLGAVGGALTLAGGTLQTTADITTARAVTLAAPGGAFNTDAATTLALSGAVTGNGALTKDGAGTLRLTGTNSYSGGTAITAGTLMAGGSSLGTGAIVDNAALVIDEAGNTTMANALSGSGTVTKTGAGQVLYTGNGAAFNGALLVSGGTFSVNGTLGGTTTIASGATLKGSGTLGTTILSSGATVAPGNSIGTLTVNGDFTFEPGSRYEVETNAAGQSDLLRVSGVATLGGASVIVIPANGSYAPSTTYTILTSGNRVGTFGSVSSNFAFLDPTLRYVANDVQLTLVRNTVAFPAVGTTPNQKASAAALESLSSGTLFNAVVQLNAATAQSAFNQLSGEIHASAQTAMLEDSRFVREAGLDRVRQAQSQGQGGGASGMSVQDQGAGNSTWARVFGSQGHINGDGNASRLNRDVAGFFVGADSTMANGWRAGGLVGYSKADMDIDGLNSTAKADSYHVGVYGGNQWDNTALRVGASYSWNKLNTQRNVGFTGLADSLKSSYDASTTQIFGEIGQKMNMGSMALEPFAGLAYVNVDTKDFRESGGAAALHSSGGSTDSTFSTLGVRASTSLSESTKLRGTLGWRHAFGNKTPTSSNAFATGQSFTVAGVPLAKNVAVVEAGMETQLQSNMTLGASYAGQFGNGLKDHGFKVTLGWKF